MNIKTIITDLKLHEGWRSEGYLDTLGVPTIGYGFTWLDPEEGEWLLERRVCRCMNGLRRRWEPFSDMPPQVQRALVNMSYQLGVDGVLKFRKTLAFLESHEYGKAADEALQSKWARQTPKRAKEVTDWIRWADCVQPNQCVF